MLQKTVKPLLLLTVAIAVYFLAAKDAGTIREALDRRKEKAQAIFTKIEFSRWQGTDLVASVQADSGECFAPNIMELRGRVYGSRTLPRKESFRANSALAYFESSHLSDLLRGSEISSIHMRDNVTISDSTGLALFTHYAKYDAQQQEVSGEHLVRVTGNDMWLRAERGFHYSLVAEELELFGRVSGEAEVEE